LELLTRALAKLRTSPPRNVARCILRSFSYNEPAYKGFQGLQEFVELGRQDATWRAEALAMLFGLAIGSPS